MSDRQVKDLTRALREVLDRHAERQVSLLSDFMGEPLDKKPRGVKPVSDDPDEVRRAKRALLRRAKRSETKWAKWLQLHDGQDKRLSHLTTSTGRVGDVTRLQFDLLSRSYTGEVKNVKWPVKIAKWWQQVCQVAPSWDKSPALILDGSDADKYKVNGKPLPPMHCITPERHAWLLECERRCLDT